MAQRHKKKCYEYNFLPSFLVQRQTGLALLFFIGFLNCSEYNGVFAFTQSHQGSASTTEHLLSGSSPNTRIQISASNVVHVVNVEPPGKGSWKVSLELLALQLCEPAHTLGGDKLKVVYSDPSSIKSFSWKLNASYPTQDGRNNKGEQRELNNIQAMQIVLLPEGRWTLSGADLVATLYQDPSADGSCPAETFSCSCISSKVTRCIPNALVCNGHPNCGGGCRHDESDSCSDLSLSSPSSSPITGCIPTTVKPPLESSSSAAHVVNPKVTSASVAAINVVLAILISKLLF